MENKIRSIRTLKDGWKFKPGDAKEKTGVDFDDSQWETVRVPHDWAIKGPFDKNNDIHVIPFIKKRGKKFISHTGRTGGLPHVGKAWYRFSFNLPQNIYSKQVSIEFDGVMSHSKVYCNGKYAGEWPYGYSSFAFDITGFVHPGKNVLAVSVDNKNDASRWYPGAGIYRNVRLVITSPVHISHWGTYVTTPSISKNRAKIKMQTVIENHTGKKQRVELETRIFDPKGKSVAVESDTKIVMGSKVFLQKFNITSPVLWSVRSPELYTARSYVKIEGSHVDTYETTFGIRTLRFDAEKGFFLNGENLQFKGVCMHHDLGPLGTAVNKTALKRQMTILKEMGCNAIRTSHNPPAPELLEIADTMGFLVIDEAFDEWRIPKCKNGYNILFDRWSEKDLRAMIRRDRNHPSVIMWSIGNEIPEQGDAKTGVRTARFLHNICHKEDPTRPTTSAFNSPESAIKNRLAATVDVPGWNYTPHLYGWYHTEHPNWPMYGSETASCISSRGEYYFPVAEEKNHKRSTLQVNSYDLSTPDWATIPDIAFRGIDENPFIMGEFVWTGFDYLGEPTPYGKEWPSRSSYFGIVDLCGIPKDRFYLYQSRWADRGTLHLLPHWTWPGREGELTPVHCYSSWDRVELFVNGVSQGVRSKNPRSFLDRYRLTWNGVVYKPGELKAVAYDRKGKPVKETTVRTAGKPARIKLLADRKRIKSDGDDMAFICASVVDSKKNLCPRADNLIRFKIKGPAEIAAVGNGNPTSTEPFQVNYRKAFNGKCLLYLRSVRGLQGTITITAESEGLKETKIIIRTR
jgi:beta-galactosidase